MVNDVASVKKYTQKIERGRTTITHNLGERDIIVVPYDKDGSSLLNWSMQINSADQFSIRVDRPCTVVVIA